MDQEGQHELDTPLYVANHVSLTYIPCFTAQVDIFSKELLLIPIHMQLHWYLCVVRLKDKRIECYDSLNISRASQMNVS